MSFPGKLRFQLPPDLRGQLWVAAGVPLGLATLARAMHELEAAVHRRHDLLHELDARIAARRVELGRLLAEPPAYEEPEPGCDSCGTTGGPGTHGDLCEAPLVQGAYGQGPDKGGWRLQGEASAANGSAPEPAATPAS